MGKFQKPLLTKVPPGSVAAGFHLADSPVAYAWDFGDGTTLQTNEPWTDHDYVAALDTSTEQRYSISRCA
ncbi:MAG: PKD domain-containing protein [Chlorobiaceae bacterium]|nr:PKD domain-containing protein [Chlorobiaceae bacterium]